MGDERGGGTDAGRVARLRRAYQRATAGEWSAMPTNDGYIRGSGRRWVNPTVPVAIDDNDAYFIATAHNDMPALLDLGEEALAGRTIVAAARDYYAAYRAECVAHASDGPEWVARTTVAHQVRQDAEERLFRALDPAFDPREEFAALKRAVCPDTARQNATEGAETARLEEEV